MTERGLLIAMLALKHDFICPSQLIDAFRGWLSDRSHSIDSTLLKVGAIQPVEQALLDQLASTYLDRSGNDLSVSLQQLTSTSLVRSALLAAADGQVAKLESMPWFSRSVVEPTTSHVGGSRREREYGSHNPRIDPDRFRVLKQHAQGGLGVVYLAEDQQLHREVALKQIRNDKADVDVYRQKFTQEAEVTGQLEHPGIVPVYALGEDERGRPFYAMRFIRGESLRNGIQDFHAVAQNAGVDFASPEFRHLLRRFIDVCNAMQYAHDRGVLHRDLKPANIMLGKYGETLVVDWGLAKPIGQQIDTGATPTLESEAERPVERPSAEAGSETRIGTFVGTAAYASPEQLRGELDRLSPASDVFGLGAVLFEIVTGVAPIRNATSIEEVLSQIESNYIAGPIQLNKSLPRSVDGICRKAIAPDPNDRYQSVDLLRDDVQRWLDDMEVGACPDSAVQKSLRWCRKHRTLVTASVAGLIVFLLATSAWLRHSTQVALKQQELQNQLAITQLSVQLANQEVEAQRLKAETVRILGQASEQRAHEVQSLLAEILDIPDSIENLEDVSYADALEAVAERIGVAQREQPIARIQAVLPIARNLQRAGRNAAAYLALSRAMESGDRPGILGTDGVLGTYECDRSLVAIIERGERTGIPISKGNVLSRIETMWQGLERFSGSQTIEAVRYKALLGHAHASFGDATRSLSLLQEVAKTVTEVKTATREDAESINLSLAQSLRRNKRFEQARELLAIRCQNAERQFGHNHRRTLLIKEMVADTYLDEGRKEVAAQIYAELKSRMGEKFGAGHIDSIRIADKLLSSTGKVANSAATNRSLLSVKTLPRDLAVRRSFENRILSEIERLRYNGNGDGKLNETVVVGRIVNTDISGISSDSFFPGGYFAFRHKLGGPFAIVAHGCHPLRQKIPDNPGVVVDLGNLQFERLSSTETVRLEFSVVDEQNRPIDGCEVRLYLERGASLDAGIWATFKLSRVEPGVYAIDGCGRHDYSIVIAHPDRVRHDSHIRLDQISDADHVVRNLVVLERPMQLELEYLVFADGAFNGPIKTERLVGGQRLVTQPPLNNWFFDLEVRQMQSKLSFSFSHQPVINRDLGIGQLEQLKSSAVKQVEEAQSKAPGSVATSAHEDFEPVPEHVYLLHRVNHKRHVLLRVKSISPPAPARSDGPVPNDMPKGFRRGNTIDDAVARCRAMRQPGRNGIDTKVNGNTVEYPDLLIFFKESSQLDIVNGGITSLMWDVEAPTSLIRAVTFDRCDFKSLKVQEVKFTETNQVKTSTLTIADNEVFAGLSQLRSLSLTNCQGLPPEFLIRFQKCPALETLTLDGTVASQQLIHAVTGFSQVKSLRWMRSRMDAKGAAALGEMKSLESVSLALEPRLTSQVSESLSKLGKLRDVDLGYCGLGQTSLESFQELQQIDALGINNCQLSDGQLTWLPRMLKLKQLNIGGNSVTDAIVDVLLQMPALERVYIYHTGLTDAGFERLLRKPELTLISIGGTQVSAGAIDSAKKSHPQLQIITK